jgi:hypothetical protein
LRQKECILSTDGLAVIAEVAIGLAGFSGILIVLTRPDGGFNPPERFRLRVLVFSSMGALFLAMIPFAVLDSDWSDHTSWQILGALVLIYTLYGLVSLPRISFELRRQYPDIFPLRLILTQVATHLGTLGLALPLCFGTSSNQQNLYTGALILILVHGAIAFVRLLFYRRH